VIQEPELRTAKINPDRRFVGVLAICLVTIVMGSSMVFSYVAIAEAAQWTGVPGVWWVAPIFIDGAIITYTVSLMVFEWRMEPRKTIRHTVRVLRAFTFMSVALNFAHTASFWAWDFTIYEAWFGSLIAVCAPIAALLSAEEGVRLMFKRRRPSEQAEHEALEAALEREKLAAVAELTSMFGQPEQTAPAEVAVHEPVASPPVAPAPVNPEPALTPALVGAGSVSSAPVDYGIVRYPAQGEYIIGQHDTSTDSDRLI
jgi:heme/copper-type cytochrome/quinol oxidase subunit 2